MFEKDINLIDIQTIAVSLIVLAVSILRLIPHVNNFSPIIALAIFGALHYKSKNLSYIIPLLALWFSDLLINNFIYKLSSGFELFYEGLNELFGISVSPNLGNFFISLIRSLNLYVLIPVCNK